MKLLLSNRFTFDLLHKANRIDCLIYYQTVNPFIYIETIKNRYEEGGLVEIPSDMRENLLAELKKLNTFNFRVNLILDTQPTSLLPYDKIFRYEHILMLQSGLVDYLELFPEMF